MHIPFVREQGIKIYVADIILVDGQGRILLQHRSADAPTYPNHYCTFGGHIEEGEDPLTAIKRECREELEYELVHPEFLFSFTCDSRHGKVMKYIFYEKYDSSKPLIQHEGDGIRWVSEHEMDQLTIVNQDMYQIKKFFALRSDKDNAS